MWTFSCPTVVYGEGALDCLKRIQHKKALVLTEKAVILSGLHQHVTDRLEAAGSQWLVYDQVGEAPAGDVVGRAARMAREYQPDWIIALGGRSCTQIAEAVMARTSPPGLSAGMPDSALDAPGVWRLMLIPVAPGGNGDHPAVFDEVYGGVGFESHGGGADMAILAPEMFLHFSARALAHIGMEALCKAVESYVSPWGGNMSDGPALIAVRQIFENLSDACLSSGGGVESRVQLQQAAFLADLAATHASTGFAYGAAGGLAEIHGLSHRFAAGLLLPYTMDYLIRHSIQITARYAEIARFCGIFHDTAMDGAQALVARIRACAEEAGWPLYLSAYLEDREGFETSLPHLIDRALEQTSHLDGVRIADKTHLAEFFRCAYVGRPFHG